MIHELTCSSSGKSSVAQLPAVSLQHEPVFIYIERVTAGKLSNDLLELLLVRRTEVDRNSESRRKRKLLLNRIRLMNISSGIFPI